MRFRLPSPTLLFLPFRPLFRCSRRWPSAPFRGPLPHTCHRATRLGPAGLASTSSFRVAPVVSGCCRRVGDRGNGGWAGRPIRGPVSRPSRGSGAAEPCSALPNLAIDDQVALGLSSLSRIRTMSGPAHDLPASPAVEDAVEADAAMDEPGESVSWEWAKPELGLMRLRSTAGHAAEAAGCEAAQGAPAVAEDAGRRPPDRVRG
jgi:hypothetical protein